MTTGKTILIALTLWTLALTIWTFFGRVTSLVFNCLGLSFNFVPRNNCLAAVTIYSDLEPKKRKSVTTSTFLLSICHAVMGPDAMILVCLFVCLFCLNPTLSLSSFILIKRLFSSSSLSAIRVLSSTHLRLLMFLLPILISAWNSSSLAFLMKLSVYRLNKQGEQQTVLSHSFLNLKPIPYRVLTVASWPAYRFLRRSVRCSGIPISLRIFHCLLWSTEPQALVYSVTQK